MRIEALDWISKEAEEAEVVVSDGRYSCRAFSQPCSLVVGQALQEPLHIFGAKHVMLSADDEQELRPLSTGRLSHKVTAKIQDLRSKRLSVGGIELIMDDYLPGGIQDGDTIEFECARLDIW